MSTDISIYLLKKRTTFNNALKHEKADSEYKESPLRDNKELLYEHRLHLKKADPKEPVWATWLSTNFETGDPPPQVSSASGVLLIKSSRRVFALCFGQGRYALAQDRIEADFGLRVALQRVAPDKLRKLESKTLEFRTRQKSTYHHAGGSIDEFGMSLDTEWLRTLAGKSSDTDSYTSLAGSSALKLTNYKKKLSELGVLCKNCLTDYQKALPDSFSFIEHILPLGKDDPVATDLNAKLARQLKANNFTDLEVIVDAAIVDESQGQEIFRGRVREPLEELSTKSIQAAVMRLSARDASITADNCKIDFFDANGERTDLKSLPKLVNAQFEYDGETYVQIEGRWIRVSQSYIDDLDRQIKKLSTATTRLALPKWSKKKHPKELGYNTRVAGMKDWLLQDQVFLYPDGAKGAAIECCDLMTEDGELIHVKRGSSSSDLNHLFGQISAAANLYRQHGKSEKVINDRYASKWPTGDLAGKQIKFIAAIGRKKVTDALLGKMLVAKINLLDHARRIRSMHFDFQVAGFETTD